MYDIEWVREAVARVKEDGRGNPRVHPNGFIQLDLIPVAEDWHASHQKGHSGATLRLHIWDPPGHELPHQETVNEIHTHVFDMRSAVIRGTLMQRCYAFVVGKELRQKIMPPRFVLYKAIYAKTADSRLEDTGITGYLEEHLDYRVYPEMSYTQPAFTFHDTQVYEGPLVTVMTKEEVYEGDAYVCCPVGSPPDNSYDRAAAAPEDFLWSAIEASIA